VPTTWCPKLCLLHAEVVAALARRELPVAAAGHEHRSARMREETHADSPCFALKWPGDGSPARVRATRIIMLESKAAESFVPEVGIARAVMRRRAVDCT
jgi:hypothetical protein